MKTKDEIEGRLQKSECPVVYFDTSNRHASGREHFRSLCPDRESVELNFRTPQDEQEKITRIWLEERTKRGYPVPEKSFDDLVDFQASLNESIEFGGGVEIQKDSDQAYDIFKHAFSIPTKDKAKERNII